jgi:hypothetical protein
MSNSNADVSLPMGEHVWSPSPSPSFLSLPMSIYIKLFECVVWQQSFVSDFDILWNVVRTIMSVEEI